MNGRKSAIHDSIKKWVCKVAGCGVFEKALQKYPSLQGGCADAGYRKTMEEFVEKVLKKTIEISKRIKPGWAILAKRWIVSSAHLLG